MERRGSFQRNETVNGAEGRDRRVIRGETAEKKEIARAVG